MAGIDSLIGLSRIKRMASRDVRASLLTGNPFPHTLLSGPGGLGKTALAKAIAFDLRYHYFRIEGAAVGNRRSLIGLLREASDEAVARRRKLFFFVDEAHRLGATQEVMYLPMSEGLITTADGEISFPAFTLMAATTHPNKLLKSFLRRLQNRWVLQRYNVLHIRQMIAKWLSNQGYDFEPGVVVEIANRSLGSPSQAIETLCVKICNEAIFQSGTKSSGHLVTQRACFSTFSLEGIDNLGLTDLHRRYLRALLVAQGVPKGLSAVAGRLGEDEDVVSGSIEPDLLSLNLIDLTSRGRVLTKSGRTHIEGETRC